MTVEIIAQVEELAMQQGMPKAKSDDDKHIQQKNTKQSTRNTTRVDYNRLHNKGFTFASRLKLMKQKYITR